MVAPHFTSYGSGHYVASEASAVFVPGRWNGGRPPVVVAHGAGGTAVSAFLSHHHWFRSLAEAGWPLFFCDLGGTHTWGNDTSIARVSQVLAWARSSWGCSNDPALGIAMSMGALALFNTARATPGNWAGITTVLGAYDLADLHSKETASVNAAYGGSYVDATERAAHNPAYYLPLGELDAVPILTFYADDDTVTVPALESAALASHPSATRTSLGAVGHTVAAVGMTDSDAIDEFFRTATGLAQ